jgi:hypothetical protein
LTTFSVDKCPAAFAYNAALAGLVAFCPDPFQRHSLGPYCLAHAPILLFVAGIPVSLAIVCGDA